MSTCYHLLQLLFLCSRPSQRKSHLLFFLLKFCPLRSVLSPSLQIISEMQVLVVISFFEHCLTTLSYHKTMSFRIYWNHVYANKPDKRELSRTRIFRHIDFCDFTIHDLLAINVRYVFCLVRYPMSTGVL